MSLVLTVLFICIYLVAFFYRNKNVAWKLTPKISGPLKKVHFTALFFCIIVALLYGVFSLGLRGQWTTRIVIILTLLTGIFFRLISNEASKSKIEKWYFKIFSLVPMFMAGTLLIPFLGVVMVLSLIGKLVMPVNNIYYEDEKLRVQSTYQGMLIPAKIDIFAKHFIFEKHLKTSDYNEMDVGHIKVFFDADSTRVVAYGLYRDEEERKDQTETLSFPPIK
ncbi:hypothetical protein ACFQZS_08910 [Mucilaginibacter calamicampi]|uniref:Uncharacterized protein n=1 Tax=Mucilaginibacter calamicampi TaxID=1302352 RepID=A0ABW2YYF5_9SPHI